MAQKATKKEKKLGFSQFISFTEKNFNFDLPILIILILILIYGLMMLYSASYVKGIYQFGDSLHYIKGQVVFAIIGFVLMLIISKIDYQSYKRYDKALFGIVVFLLIVVLFMEPINYATRWITLPFIPTFQPSEIAKFSIILLFAKLIEKNYSKMKTFKYGILPFALSLAIISVLLYLEPHNSAIIITVAIGGIMMIVGGVDLKKIIIYGTLLLIVLGVIFYLSYDLIEPFIGQYVVRIEERIVSWLNPDTDILDSNYQTYQSKLAIGSGGLFGLGLGNSRQKHLHLPEPQNDFIFAVICEELGFVGGMLVIVLFILLMLRGFYIAAKAKDKFGAFLVIGIIAQIVIQAFLNIGVATGTLPSTGIALPFFSEGGTSLVMLLCQMGIVLSVSRYANLN